jgi:hypothetical protein
MFFETMRPESAESAASLLGTENLYRLFFDPAADRDFPFNRWRDGVDGARAAFGSMKGRAKMVVVRATVGRSAVHGKVYH